MIEDKLENRQLEAIPLATVIPVALDVVSKVVSGLKKRKELDDYQIQQLQSLPPEYQALILGELRNKKNKRKEFPAIFEKYLKQWMEEKRKMELEKAKTFSPKETEKEKTKIPIWLPISIGAGFFLIILILLLKRR